MLFILFIFPLRFKYQQINQNDDGGYCYDRGAGSKINQFQAIPDNNQYDYGRSASSDQRIVFGFQFLNSSRLLKRISCIFV
jgi:hypothetical protein